MQQTIDPTAEAVAQCKSDVERFSARLLHVLSFVPDDKLTWAPSPTAKSSLDIVAHCATTNTFFADIITGNLPDSMPSPDEVLKGLHERTGQIPSRESAIALVRESTTQLCKAIDTVNPETINAPRNSPFGPMPTQFWINQGGEHLAGHGRQLEYLQTIWGDLDNHFS